MKYYLPVILLAVLFTIPIGTALAENETYNASAFQQALEQNGFTVQEGELGYFDLIGLLEKGVLPSAYGNNPTTKYVAFLFQQQLVMK